MIDDSATPLRPMYPVRHRPSLFSVDIGSISLKDVQQQMEHPFFTLSKKPDLETRRYEDRHGNSIEISPHSLGLPTIYDKDVLIYAISHVMAQRNRGEAVSRRIILYAADMLEFANRPLGGTQYRALDKALTRLRGCTIKTNIKTGDIYQTEIFGLIERANFKRKYGWNGRLQHVEITLSEWLWNAIEANQVLTLHPDYFRLRKPIERRIYEIARKHCGKQSSWQIGLALLKDKAGSKSPLFLFRQAVRKLTVEGDLLDYRLEYDRARDMAMFRRTEGSLIASMGPVSEIRLPASVVPIAHKQFGPDIDLDKAEKKFRDWLRQKGLRPTNPPALFLKFLERLSEGNDLPTLEDNRKTLSEELAEEWWQALDADRQQYWRQKIGPRVELSDGEGWWISENVIAERAFRQRWPQTGSEPWKAELPPPLMARARAIAGPKADMEAIVSAFRHYSDGRHYIENIVFSSFLDFVKDADLEVIASRSAAIEKKKHREAALEDRLVLIKKLASQGDNADLQRALAAWAATLEDSQ